MTTTVQTGRRGEEEACRYLVDAGHTILARNWRSGHLEVDIVSLDGEGLHIVEVKSRTAPCVADPESNIGPGKIKSLCRAAGACLKKWGKELGDTEVFFDVFSIVFDGDNTVINYIPKAFIPIYD